MLVYLCSDPTVYSDYGPFMPGFVTVTYMYILVYLCSDPTAYSDHGSFMPGFITVTNMLVYLCLDPTAYSDYGPFMPGFVTVPYDNLDALEKELQVQIYFSYTFTCCTKKVLIFFFIPSFATKKYLIAQFCE